MGAAWPQGGNNGGDKTTVVCMGDSITFGHGLEDRDRLSYPAQLQRILGRRHRVLNCGRSGACATATGDLPYWDLPEYTAGVEASPSVIVLLLGTNDCKPENWSVGTFEEDLGREIRSLAALSTCPTVLLCRPPPLFFGYAAEHAAMLAAVDRVASAGLSDGAVGAVVDAHTALNNETLFPDMVHPGAEGARRLAEAVYGVMKTLQKKV